eukprot:143917_1
MNNGNNITTMNRFSFGSSNSNNTTSNHSSQSSPPIGWSCKECTFQNTINSTQCKICQTKRSTKRIINELNNYNQPPSKKRKINTGNNILDLHSTDDMDTDNNENINNINGNNHNHNHNKPHKLNSKIVGLPQPKQNNNNNDIQQLYFPSNHNKKMEEKQDDTLNNMNNFAAAQPKIERIKKEESPFIVMNMYNEDDEMIDRQLHMNDTDTYIFDCDFCSHLTDEMYSYYSGEDMEALDWSGNDYNENQLWELEKQFFKWKNIYRGCVLMIQNGYKYEFYETDAFIVSHVLGVQSTNKRGALLKVLLPDHKLDVYLRRLVEVGLMVAVISQTQTGATMDRKTQKLINREITGVYTKGTLFFPHITDLNMDNEINKIYMDHNYPESRYILSFNEIPLDGEFDMANNVEFNIILCDLYSGYLYYQQFEDTFLRPKFLTILNHFNIVEIILPEKEISNNTRHILENRYNKLGTKNAVRWVLYK